MIQIAKKLKLKNNLFLKTIQNFKGLKYRQQTILKKKGLTIISNNYFIYNVHYHSFNIWS